MSDMHMHPASARSTTTGRSDALVHVRTYERTNADTSHQMRDRVEVSNARDVRRAVSGLREWEAFDWTAIPGGQVRLPRDYRAGWLYVIEFSFGVVKPGRSIAPRERIRRHVQEATRFDGYVSRFWLSPCREDWKANESALLLWCYANGRQTHGEYFADLPYLDVVAFAKTLTDARLYAFDLLDAAKRRGA